MNDSSVILHATAISVAIVHTLLGPDHYLPFAAMAQAEKWTLARTLRVTFVCGLGHVLGSVLVGGVGIAVGVGLLRLEQVEALRGDLAGWLMIAGGLSYLVWGLRQAARRRPHTHLHAHADGTVHSHKHSHVSHHVHLHDARAVQSRSPLLVFVIFIFGPCEPLIPLLMYPASQGNTVNVATVALLFAAATLLTMLGAVVACVRLASLARPERLERFGHAVAGAILLACGVAVHLGL